MKCEKCKKDCVELSCYKPYESADKWYCDKCFEKKYGEIKITFKNGSYIDFDNSENFNKIRGLNVRDNSTTN